MKNISERRFQSHGGWRSTSAMNGYVADSQEKHLAVTQALGY
jgi:hypothetical protein